MVSTGGRGALTHRTQKRHSTMEPGAQTQGNLRTLRTAGRGALTHRDLRILGTWGPADEGCSPTGPTGNLTLTGHSHHTQDPEETEHCRARGAHPQDPVHTGEWSGSGAQPQEVGHTPRCWGGALILNHLATLSKKG